MDAHVFRRLAPELAQALRGARIDKVFCPASGVFTLALSSPRGKQALLFRPHRSEAILYLGDSRPENPAVPPAAAMWLRKRLKGRRILGHRQDWPGRRLALELTPSSQGFGNWLVLDLVAGPTVVDDPPEPLDREPHWPPLESALGDETVWQDHPHLSPPLRRTLKALPDTEAASVYESLRAGPAPRLYLAVQNGLPVGLSAWPLRTEDVRTFESALEAARAYGEPRLFGGIARQAQAPEEAARRTQAKKLKRSLERLEQDQRRLAGMAEQQRQAEALQAELYKHTGGPTPERVVVEHPRLGPMAVELNTTLSVAENMQALFKAAAKGKRGLAAVEKRREQLAEAGRQPQPAPSPAAKGAGRAAKGTRGVARFTTADGFTVLRAKSQEAGHQMLSRAASPFDYWFHAAQRSGAHVILKRDHPGQQVPEQSLQQAAVLAGLASGWSGEAHAEVLCAMVKDVRKIKGAALGLVRVEEVWRTFRVELDPDLPGRLAAPDGAAS